MLLSVFFSSWEHVLVLSVTQIATCLAKVLKRQLPQIKTRFSKVAFFGSWFVYGFGQSWSLLESIQLGFFQNEKNKLKRKPQFDCF